MYPSKLIRRIQNEDVNFTLLILTIAVAVRVSPSLSAGPELDRKTFFGLSHRICRSVENQ